MRDDEEDEEVSGEEPADSEREDETDDEDDGGLEVDVVDGSTRLAKPGYPRMKQSQSNTS